MTFGEKLKSMRTERDLTQDELATLLGTSKQVISRYETNQRTPKITVAQKYADKLNVSIDYLIDDNIEDSGYTPHPHDFEVQSGKVISYADLSPENQRLFEDFYKLLKTKEASENGKQI